MRHATNHSCECFIPEPRDQDEIEAQNEREREREANGAQKRSIVVRKFAVKHVKAQEVRPAPSAPLDRDVA